MEFFDYLGEGIILAGVPVPLALDFQETQINLPFIPIFSSSSTCFCHGGAFPSSIHRPNILSFKSTRFRLTSSIRLSDWLRKQMNHLRYDA